MSEVNVTVDYDNDEIRAEGRVIYKKPKFTNISMIDFTKIFDELFNIIQTSNLELVVQDEGENHHISSW